MERLIYFRCANGAKVSTGPPKGSAMSVWPTGMSCPGGRSFSFVPGSCLRGVLEGAIVSAPRSGQAGSGAGPAAPGPPVRGPGGDGPGAPVCRRIFSLSISRSSDKIEAVLCRAFPNRRPLAAGSPSGNFMEIRMRPQKMQSICSYPVLLSQTIRWRNT